MRRRLAQLRELQLLHRIEADLAAADHADAQAQSAAAESAAARATDAVHVLAGTWYDGRASGRFDPDLDAGIAGRLIGAEQRMIAAQASAFAAATNRETRAEAWRVTEARRRATGTLLRDARRAVARAEDEAQLDMVAARTLDRWRRS